MTDKIVESAIRNGQIRNAQKVVNFTGGVELLVRIQIRLML